MDYIEPELLSGDILPSYQIQQNYVFSVDRAIVSKHQIIEHFITHELALSFDVFPDCHINFSLYDGIQQIIPPIFCQYQHEVVLNETQIVYSFNQIFTLPLKVSELKPTYRLCFQLNIAGFVRNTKIPIYKTVIDKSLLQLQQGVLLIGSMFEVNLHTNQLPIYFMEQGFDIEMTKQTLKIKVPDKKLEKAALENFLNLDFKEHCTSIALMDYQRQRFTSQVLKHTSNHQVQERIRDQWIKSYSGLHEVENQLLPLLDVFDSTSKCDVMDCIDEMWKKDPKDPTAQIPNVYKGLKQLQQSRYSDQATLIFPKKKKLDLSDPSLIKTSVKSFMEGQHIQNPQQNNLDYISTMPQQIKMHVFKDIQRFKLEDSQMIPDPQEKLEIDKALRKDLPPVYKMNNKAEQFYKYRYFIRTNYKNSFRFLVESIIIRFKDEPDKIDFSFFEEGFSPSVSDCLYLLGKGYKNFPDLRQTAIYQLKVKNKPLELTIYLMQLSLCVIYDSGRNELAMFLLDLATSYQYEFSQLHFYLILWIEVQQQKQNMQAVEKLQALDALYQERVLTLQNSNFAFDLASSIQFVNQLLMLIKNVKDDEPIDRERQKTLLKLALQNQDAYPMVVTPLQPIMFPFIFNSRKRPIYIQGVFPEKCYVFKSAKKPFLIHLKLAKDFDGINSTVTESQNVNVSEVNLSQLDQETSVADSVSVITSQISTVQPVSMSAMQPNSTTIVVPMRFASAETILPTLVKEPEDKRESIGVIFKFDDDVRNDVMVLQLFQLMERKIKDNGMHLDPTHYASFAFSPTCGMVECVENVTSIDDIILDKSVQTIEKYFLSKQKNVEDYQHQQKLLQNQKYKFTRSVALYSILTYILAIGDRHMENILIQPSGKMFHIDFGWLFGRDPKPRPAQMKISGEMVLAMGGVESKLFNQFLGFLTNSYRIIRKNSNIIVVLLLMLSDSGIKVVEEDLKLQPCEFAWLLDRLKLDQDDDDATIFITQLVQEQLGALFPKIIDALHRWIQQRRQ